MKKINLSIKEEYLDSNYIRYYILFQNKKICDITLKVIKGNDFDVNLLFKGSLNYFFNNESEILQKKISNSKNLTQRISIYKKMHHQIRPIIKTIIYSAELSSFIFQIESNLKDHKFSIKIKSIDLFMGTSIEVLQYTLINAIWKRLNFSPKYNLELYHLTNPYVIGKYTYNENIFKLIIPYNFIETNYILFYPEIDETLTNKLSIPFDDYEANLYEKGRKYQWKI